MSCFFVGTYTRLGGVGVALCEREGDSLRLLCADKSVADPTYVILSLDKRTLYASAADPATGEGVAFAWAVHGDKLTPLGGQKTGGSAACHLTLSPDNRYLYVSNYMTGSLAVFPLSGARIEPRIQLIEHEGRGVDPVRQERAHVHQAVFRPGTRELFVCDLGLDMVFVYSASEKDGLLTLKETMDGAKAGYGPRHLVFRDADTFCLCYEMGSAVGLFKRERGVWTSKQTLSTLPSDFGGENTAAAIKLYDNCLYVSNRGHDSIAEYALNGDGEMALVGFLATAGECPRDFAVEKDGAFLTAHQTRGGVTLSRNGRTTDALDIQGAVCICPCHASESVRRDAR